MGEDKLKDIEYRFNQALEDNDKNMAITAIEFYLELNDIDWLISELKKCRAENKELNALFELQHTRTQKAEKMWQKATGKHNTLPDLGELIRWLMAEIAELKEFNSECENRFKLMEGDRDYSQNERLRQKRHRKWCAHEMYMLRSVADQCDEDCKYHYKNAEKFKKRIGELLAILEKHGIANE